MTAKKPTAASTKRATFLKELPERRDEMVRSRCPKPEALEFVRQVGRDYGALTGAKPETDEAALELGYQTIAESLH